MFYGERCSFLAAVDATFSYVGGGVSNSQLFTKVTLLHDERYIVTYPHPTHRRPFDIEKNEMDVPLWRRFKDSGQPKSRTLYPDHSVWRGYLPNGKKKNLTGSILFHFLLFGTPSAVMNDE